MRTILILVCVAAAAMTAAAADLGNVAPIKPAATVVPVNVPDPLRQGGDIIANATVISGLPYSTTGTTAGYTDDYDEACPYSQSTSPDVVYSYTPQWESYPNIDLCGSSYDTKLYVYDANLNLVACNDDYYTGDPCGVYVSYLEMVPMSAGQTYYIVVDGYGGDFGSYVLEIYEWIGGCWIGAEPDSEGEPPLVDDYVDSYNGGCNTPPDNPFQEIAGDAGGNAFLSGRAGWYDFQGSDYRDTDWFILTMGPGETIEITSCAESPTYLFELGPQDCDAVAVLQQVESSYIHEVSMTITGYASGATVWFWAGSTSFSSPYYDTYAYHVWFSGLAPAVATEGTSWSEVKALYR